MKSKEAKAVQAFKSGFNCSQAVLMAYSDDLGIDKELAVNIASGFGGGMGRLQETCGAVSGSFMVLSVFNGKKYTDNSEKKRGSYSMIRDFSDKFKSIHGTTNCKALINCDLNTEEGQLYAKENNVFEEICEKCVSDSISIIEDLIE